MKMLMSFGPLTSIIRSPLVVFECYLQYLCRNMQKKLSPEVPFAVEVGGCAPVLASACRAWWPHALSRGALALAIPPGQSPQSHWYQPAWTARRET